MTADRLSDEAVKALWVIDHKATFCAGVPGASEPPKMKFSDLPSEAASELRAAKVCFVNDQGRLSIRPEALDEYADELAAHRRAYEQGCVAARVRAEAQFRRLFRVNTDEGRRSVVAGGLRELASCSQREGVYLTGRVNENDANALEDPAQRAPSSSADSGLASTESLESKLVAEKEGFEPSFSAKSDGNRLGFPSARRRHGS